MPVVLLLLSCKKIQNRQSFWILALQQRQEPEDPAEWTMARLLIALPFCSWLWGFFNPLSLLWVDIAKDVLCLYEWSPICLKDKSGKWRGSRFFGWKAPFQTGSEAQHWGVSALSRLGLHMQVFTLTRNYLLFKAVLRLFFKSQVCLDCFSRHFRKCYWELADSTVLYFNYQTIMDVSCLRILIWVHDCFTVCSMFHIPI